MEKMSKLPLPFETAASPPRQGLAENERAIFNALPATRRHSRESGNPSSALSRALDMDPGFRRGDD